MRLATAVLALLLAAPAVATAQEPRLRQQMEALVAADGGPPGIVVTLRRGTTTRTFTAGVADVRSGRAPTARDHMRIASVSKAYGAAVAFRLVANGRLGLDDTIGSVLPGLPRAWSRVTVRQMLGHTSGLPDYTRSDGFREQFQTDPGGFVSPRRILSWVRSDGLVFRPGSSYEYSNTDNIVVALMAERVSGRGYARLLQRIVFGPLRLERTTLALTPRLPRPRT